MKLIILFWTHVFVWSIGRLFAQLDSSSGCRNPLVDKGVLFIGCPTIFAFRAFCTWKCNTDCYMSAIIKIKCKNQAFIGSSFACLCIGFVYRRERCWTATYSWSQLEAAHREYCPSAYPTGNKMNVKAVTGASSATTTLMTGTAMSATVTNTKLIATIVANGTATAVTATIAVANSISTNVSGRTTAPLTSTVTYCPENKQPELDVSSGCHEPFKDIGVTFVGNCKPIFAVVAFFTWKCMQECKLSRNVVCTKPLDSRFDGQMSCTCVVDLTNGKNCSTNAYSWSQVEEAHSLFCPAAYAKGAKLITPTSTAATAATATANTIATGITTVTVTAGASGNSTSVSAGVTDLSTMTTSTKTTASIISCPRKMQPQLDISGNCSKPYGDIGITFVGGVGSCRPIFAVTAFFTWKCKEECNFSRVESVMCPKRLDIRFDGQMSCTCTGEPTIGKTCATGVYSWREVEVAHRLFCPDAYTPSGNTTMTSRVLTSTSAVGATKTATVTTSAEATASTSVAAVTECHVHTEPHLDNSSGCSKPFQDIGIMFVGNCKPLFAIIAFFTWKCREECKLSRIDSIMCPKPMDIRFDDEMSCTCKGDPASSKNCTTSVYSWTTVKAAHRLFCPTAYKTSGNSTTSTVMTATAVTAGMTTSARDRSAKSVPTEATRSGSPTTVIPCAKDYLDISSGCSNPFQDIGIISVGKCKPVFAVAAFFTWKCKEECSLSRVGGITCSRPLDSCFDGTMSCTCMGEPMNGKMCSTSSYSWSQVEDAHRLLCPSAYSTTVLTNANDTTTEKAMTLITTTATNVIVNTTAAKNTARGTSGDGATATGASRTGMTTSVTNVKGNTAITKTPAQGANGTGAIATGTMKNGTTKTATTATVTKNATGSTAGGACGTGTTATGTCKTGTTATAMIKMVTVTTSSTATTASKKTSTTVLKTASSTTLSSTAIAKKKTTATSKTATTKIKTSMTLSTTASLGSSSSRISTSTTPTLKTSSFTSMTAVTKTALLTTVSTSVTQCPKIGLPILDDSSGCRDPFQDIGIKFDGRCEPIFAAKAFFTWKCQVDCKLSPIEIIKCSKPLNSRFDGAISCTCIGKPTTGNERECPTMFYSWSQIEGAYRQFCASASSTTTGQATGLAKMASLNSASNANSTKATGITETLTKTVTSKTTVHAASTAKTKSAKDATKKNGKTGARDSRSSQMTTKPEKSTPKKTTWITEMSTTESTIASVETTVDDSGVDAYTSMAPTLKVHKIPESVILRNITPARSEKVPDIILTD